MKLPMNYKYSNLLMVLNFWCFLIIGNCKAQQEKVGTKRAFLVACGKYFNKDLELPQTNDDMDKFYKALLKTGFMEENISYLGDKNKENIRLLPEKKKILDELQRIVEHSNQEDTLIVCFNGHGIRTKNESTSYFLPIDASLEKLETMIPMDGKNSVYEVLNKAVKKGVKVLLIVGACRNEIAQNSQAALKMELDNETNEDSPKGIALLYSCRPGQKSYYHPTEGSYFFNHLSKAWVGEYNEGMDSVTIEDVFAKVTAMTSKNVKDLLDSSQIPEVKRKYDGTWTVNKFSAAEKNDIKKILGFYDEDEIEKLRGFLIKKKFSKDLILKQASDGNPDSLFLLAEIYHYGIGVEKDISETIKHLVAASKMGHGEAMTVLALVYFGLDKSEQGKIWLEKACNRDVATAFLTRGRCHNTPLDFGPFKKNEKEALKYFELAASLGNIEAMLEIGDLYKQDAGEIKRDFVKTRMWYKKASELGSEKAKEKLIQLESVEK